MSIISAIPWRATDIPAAVPCPCGSPVRTARFRGQTTLLPSGGLLRRISVTIPIVSTEGVLGGKPRIEGTRVGVHQVGTLVRETGWSRVKVADQLGLSEDEIDAALEYYDTRPEEMAAIEAERSETVARIRERSRAPE